MEEIEDKGEGILILRGEMGSDGGGGGGEDRVKRKGAQEREKERGERKDGILIICFVRAKCHVPMGNLTGKKCHITTFFHKLNRTKNSV